MCWSFLDGKLMFFILGYFFLWWLPLILIFLDTYWLHVGPLRLISFFFFKYSYFFYVLPYPMFMKLLMLLRRRIFTFFLWKIANIYQKNSKINPQVLVTHSQQLLIHKQAINFEAYLRISLHSYIFWNMTLMDKDFH